MSSQSTYVVSIVLEGCRGRLEGVQPRGSDVDDHWVVLVLEEVEDAQKRCTHSGCPAKHLETRACGQSLRQKSS